MEYFTGQSVQNITKIKQSDIFLSVDQVSMGVVNIPISILENNEALPMGTLLNSTDAGRTWNTLTTKAYEDELSYAKDMKVYFQGHIYVSTADDNEDAPDEDNWEDLGLWDANGVLYNDLTSSKMTSVVVSATVKENNLVGSDEFLRTTLFKNKIIVK